MELPFIPQGEPVELDKAGQKYWDNNWVSNDQLPPAVNPRDRSLNNYVNYQFHLLFERLFEPLKTSNLTLLEVGCARSAWLPYFAKEFDFRVFGIDYSEVGCRKASEILKNEGVRGEVICSNFFTPPLDLINTFDVVFSLGVLEHFEDTETSLRQLVGFLKPGGRIITIIPNIPGISGWLTKIANREVYDVHVPLDRSTLYLTHINCKLDVEICDYFLFINLGVANFEKWRGSFFYRGLTRLCSWTSKLFWFFERVFIPLTPNPLTSPYIVCVARKAKA